MFFLRDQEQLRPRPGFDRVVTGRQGPDRKSFFQQSFVFFFVFPEGWGTVLYPEGRGITHFTHRSMIGLSAESRVTGLFAA